MASRGKALRAEIVPSSFGEVNALAWCDARRIAVATSEHVLVLDAASLETMVRVVVEPRVRALASAGGVLWLLDADGFVRTFDLDTGALGPAHGPFSTSELGAGDAAFFVRTLALEEHAASDGSLRMTDDIAPAGPLWAIVPRGVVTATYARVTVRERGGETRSVRLADARGRIEAVAAGSRGDWLAVAHWSPGGGPSGTFGVTIHEFEGLRERAAWRLPSKPGLVLAAGSDRVVVIDERGTVECFGSDGVSQGRVELATPVRCAALDEDGTRLTVSVDGRVASLALPRLEAVVRSPEPFRCAALRWNGDRTLHVQGKRGETHAFELDQASVAAVVARPSELEDVPAATREQLATLAGRPLESVVALEAGAFAFVTDESPRLWLTRLDAPPVKGLRLREWPESLDWNGVVLTIVTAGPQIVVVRPGDAKALLAFTPGGPVDAASTSPDGRWLAYFSEGGLELVDIARRKAAATLLVACDGASALAVVDDRIEPFGDVASALACGRRWDGIRVSRLTASDGASAKPGLVRELLDGTSTRKASRKPGA